MDAIVLEATLKTHIAEIRKRLAQAAGVAQAAEVCANAGNVEKALEIAFEVEQLLYEANTLLNAASLMKRIYKT
jgi:hypothetical protein